MPQIDFPVAASSQVVTYRDTVTLSGPNPVLPVSSTGNVGPWYVFTYPRQFIYLNQTNGAVVGSVAVDWAIRDSATVGVPEWLPLLTIPIVVVNTPIRTNLETGAAWLRFTITGLAGDVYELAATAYL